MAMEMQKALSATGVDYLREEGEAGGGGRRREEAGGRKHCNQYRLRKWSAVEEDRLAGHKRLAVYYRPPPSPSLPPSLPPPVSLSPRLHRALMALLSHFLLAFLVSYRPAAIV